MVGSRSLSAFPSVSSDGGSAVSECVFSWTKGGP